MPRSTIKPLKILLIVVGGVGKDARITQYCYHHFARVYNPAVHCLNGPGLGLGVGEKAFMTEAFSSPPGKYASLADQFIREADGILLAYSVTNKYAFQQVTEHCALIDRVREGIHPQRRGCRGRWLPPMPLLLVGIETELENSRVVSQKEGANFARKRNMEFTEIVATEASPVETLFYDIVQTIHTYNRRQGLDSSQSSQSISPTAAHQWRAILSCCTRFVVCKLQSALRPFKRKPPAAAIDLLCNAISSDQQETVRRLIRDGVDINAFDQHGSAPLHVAAAQNQIEIVKLLLENGAHVDQVAPLKGTALSVAVSRGNDEIVQILLGYGAGVDIPSDFYGNMLQVVARRDHPSIWQYLDKGTK